VAHTCFKSASVCKRSTHPGPRARHVRPERSGEGYQYEVDKFWAVGEVRNDQLVLITRRGKVRVVESNDPLVRRANWWQQIVYRDKFPDTALSLHGLQSH
jgi:hypothetical protein